MTSDRPSPKGQAAQVISLAGTLEPLKEHFNANKHRLRVVALVLPT